MRIVVSKKSNNYKMMKEGEQIKYKMSKLMRKKNIMGTGYDKYYYQLSFSYKFTEPKDKVFFSYTYPYTMTHLNQFLKNMALAKSANRTDYYQETILCKSLSGLDIPMVTITSRLTSDTNEYNLVKMSEFDDIESKVSIPMYKRKKYIIITTRVHPGETNSSYIIQGLIKYLNGNSLQA